MSKDFKLFEREEHSLTSKSIRLMDLLVSNKSSSRLECLILISINFIQLISGFFSTSIGLFDENGGVPDSYLAQLKNIIRIKDLISSNESTFETLMYIILITLFLTTILFTLILVKITKNSFYTYKEIILNTILKLFIYIFFIPVLDICLSLFCIKEAGSSECRVGGSAGITVLSLIIFVYSIFLAFLLSIYYTDSMMLSNSYYARISCNYEIYFTLNIIAFSILLNLEAYLGRIIFLIYNLIVSLLFMRFFFEKYPFYDKVTCFLVGMFHTIYAWTSIFSIVFFYFEVKLKSILYLVGVLITVMLYYTLKIRLEDRILLKTPFHKISNKFHILFYIKSLLNKINNIEDVIEDKAQSIGIIQLHAIECPLLDCPSKRKEKPYLYLPVTNEWTNRNITQINDKVYMLNFVTFVFNFFIMQNYFSPDILINVSSYYLVVIGNYCQAMIYCKKVSEMKMNSQENFFYLRIKILIKKALIEKLKPSNEVTGNLEEINTTMYFKYDDLSQKFFEEVTSDINLNLEFWRIFQKNSNILEDGKQLLDFNKVFSLTDKIRITKNKIEGLWAKLFETYNGFNDLFDLYENYIEYINDDDILRRELEGTKHKILANNDHLAVKNNMYNVLFHKDTGVMIVSGDKGKEGMIEKTNDIVEEIFDYTEEELKGMSVNFLMPKIFEKSHKSFIERYTTIGEKRIIDRVFRTYGRGKKNNLIPLTNRIKLFPMLGERICFCGLMIQDNIDDIILLDSRFNIQGMSRRLMDRLRINEALFQNCDVPFYLICQNFVDFFKSYMNNKNRPSDVITQSDLQKIEQSMASMLGKKDKDPHPEDREKMFHIEEYEVNENADLEFEIKIPFILKNYESNKTRKEKAFNFTMIKSGSHSDDENNYLNHQDAITEKSKEDDDYEEQVNLMNEQESYTADPSNKNSLKLLEEDKEKEFQNKIEYYRNFFDKKQFNLLNNEIKRITSEVKEVDCFKFVFTFQPYRFGEHQMAYVVRCIDNKDDGEYSVVSWGTGQNHHDNHQNPQNNVMNPPVNNDELAANTAINEVVFTRKKYLGALKEKYELTQEEIEECKLRQTDYHQLTLTDSRYLETLSYTREEILRSSRVFGTKKIEITIDEGSSQSSTSSYNDDLSKKARVEEIKSNMMKTVSDFYTLKFIKLIYFLVIILTITFSGIYLNILDNLFNDSLSINELSTKIFLNTFTLGNFLSTFISIRSLYEIVMKGKDVKFNTFTSADDLPKTFEDFKIYFDKQMHLTKRISDNLRIDNSNIEYNFTHFLPEESKSLYWEQIPAGYKIGQGGVTKLGFPMALERNLNEADNLLMSDFFNLEFLNTLAPDLDGQRILPQELHDRYQFYSYYSIENTYDKLLPQQIKILSTIHKIFSDYNIQNLNSGINLIIIYTVLIIILGLSYIVNIYLTNRNMELSLQKVSRISPEKIDETIKRIEYFNEKILNKYRRKEKDGDPMAPQFEVKDNSNMNDLNKNQDKRSELERKYTLQEKKFRHLEILNGSYFQIFFLVVFSCAILIPIYFSTYHMIENANLFLDMKSFIYGDLIVTSNSIVKIKCLISECNVTGDITYNNYFSSGQKQGIIDQIKFYPEIDDFYNNKYLFSICDTLHPSYSSFSNSTEYEKCSNDPVIKSANNTEALLKTIFDSIFAINKEIQIKKETKTTETISKAYESKYFREMEYIFYNYIIKIPNVCGEVFYNSLSIYMQNVRQIILMLSIIFAILMISFSFYVIFIFVEKLIHLLSISRCILRIIPTVVINNTPELEEWVENKY